MTKQEESRKSLGYLEKWPQKACGTCKHYRSKLLPVVWNPGCSKEAGIRCLLGGFSVKKLGGCPSHEFKEEE